MQTPTCSPRAQLPGLPHSEAPRSSAAPSGTCSMATCGKTGLYLREMRPRKKHTEADLVTATGAAEMSRGKICAACCPAGWIWHAVHVHNSMHQTQCCTLATSDSQTTTTRNANRRCNRQAVCNLKPPKHMTSATKKAAHETSSLASACLPVAEAQGDCQECHEPHPRARIPASHIKCRHKHCPRHRGAQQ